MDLDADRHLVVVDADGARDWPRIAERLVVNTVRLKCHYGGELVESVVTNECREAWRRAAERGGV